MTTNVHTWWKRLINPSCLFVETFLKNESLFGRIVSWNSF